MRARHLLLGRACVHPCYIRDKHGGNRPESLCEPQQDLVASACGLGLENQGLVWNLAAMLEVWGASRMRFRALKFELVDLASYPSIVHPRFESRTASPWRTGTNPTSIACLTSWIPSLTTSSPEEHAHAGNGCMATAGIPFDTSAVTTVWLRRVTLLLTSAKPSIPSPPASAPAFWPSLNPRLVSASGDANRV